MRSKSIADHPPASGTITISYTFISIASVILLLIIGLIRLIDYKLNLGIRLSEYISMCSFGCVTIGLLYNATSLRYNYEINKIKFEKEEDDAEKDKIRFTYQLTSEWFKADMAMNAEIVRRFISPYKGKLKQATQLQEFKVKLMADESLVIRKSLISNLNYFENLSLLLADNIIDEVILKKCFRTLFTQYYDNLKEFIEDEQRENNGGNSKIFINFVTLCKKWNAS
jgi:hypothetical protein